MLPEAGEGFGAVLGEGDVVWVGDGHVQVGRGRGGVGVVVPRRLVDGAGPLDATRATAAGASGPVVVAAIKVSVGEAGASLTDLFPFSSKRPCPFVHQWCWSHAQFSPIACK